MFRTVRSRTFRHNVDRAVRNAYTGVVARPRTFDEIETREAIRSQFWETGYAATSVDDLTQCTGLGKGSLYGAFGTKHDMYVEALREYCDEVIAQFTDALVGDDAGAANRVRTFLKNYAKNARAMQNGCLLSKAVSELAGRDADVDRLAKATFKRMEELFRDAVRAAQRAGDVAPDVDAGRVAVTLFTIVRGMESLAKTGASTATLTAAAEGGLALLSS